MSENNDLLMVLLMTSTDITNCHNTYDDSTYHLLLVIVLTRWKVCEMSTVLEIFWQHAMYWLFYIYYIVFI